MEVKGKRVKLSIWVSLSSAPGDVPLSFHHLRIQQGKNDFEQSRPHTTVELKV
jgi:hypothetical protein